MNSWVPQIAQQDSLMCRVEEGKIEESLMEDQNSSYFMMNSDKNESIFYSGAPQDIILGSDEDDENMLYVRKQPQLDGITSPNFAGAAD